MVFIIISWIVFGILWYSSRKKDGMAAAGPAKMSDADKALLDKLRNRSYAWVSSKRTLNPTTPRAEDHCRAPSYTLQVEETKAGSSGKTGLSVHFNEVREWSPVSHLGAAQEPKFLTSCPTPNSQDQIEAMTKMPVVTTAGSLVSDQTTPPRQKRPYDPAPKAKASPAPKPDIEEGEIDAAAELRQKLRSRNAAATPTPTADVDEGFREIAARSQPSQDLDAEIDDLDAQLDDLMGTL